MNNTLDNYRILQCDLATILGRKGFTGQKRFYIIDNIERPFYEPGGGECNFNLARMEEHYKIIDRMSAADINKLYGKRRKR